jgi:GR25 family glycosyltransferase involved in LPS biosynthesis
MIKLKKAYEGVTITKQVVQGVAITFNANTVPEDHYQNYYDLGLTEPFDTVKEKPVWRYVNDYFDDHIFCINLAERTDRLALCKAEFEKHGLIVQRFEGIQRTLRERQGKALLSTKFGEEGCLLSHLALLELMVEKGWQRMLILEDDVEFREDFQWLFENAVLDGKVPEDWDMLYLGAHNFTKPIPINDVVSRCTRSYTTSSYAVTLSAAKRLIPLLRASTKQVDVTYVEKAQPQMNAYVFYPWIACQRDGYSDIQDREVQYRQYFDK